MPARHHPLHRRADGNGPMCRPLAPREAPEGVLALDPPGDLDPLDVPDLLHAADLLEMLPQAARRDLAASLGEVG